MDEDKLLKNLNNVSNDYFKVFKNRIKFLDKKVKPMYKNWDYNKEDIFRLEGEIEGILYCIFKIDINKYYEINEWYTKL